MLHPPPRVFGGAKNTMNTFVLIFRQETPLSASQRQDRAQETRPWAERMNAQGHNLSPRFLAPESHRIAADGRSETEAVAISALLFLEAESFAEAVQIAQSHPAVGYGASVEVRAWADAQL